MCVLGTKQTALEVLLALVESRPAMMRKMEGFSETVVPILLDWMADMEDSPEWHNTADVI